MVRDAYRSRPEPTPPQHPRMPRLVSVLPVLLVLGTIITVFALDPFAPRVRRAVAHPDAGPLVENVTYCTAGGVALKLDLFLAKPSYQGPRPLLVYVHGGGWTEGDKTWVDRIMSSGELALHGYTVASVNYRLAPLHPWPAQIEDVKCAIRFLRAHSQEYNIDPARIGVWGESAGGHLAAMLGLTGPEDGLEGSGGYHEQSSRVQAVVDMFGPADLVAMGAETPQNRLMGYLLLGTTPTESRLRNASPVSYASPDDPPFLLMHGEKDDLVSFSHSTALRDSLHAAGVPVTLVSVRNGSHVFVPRGGPISPSGQEIKAIATRFFDLYLHP
ncbi:MAG: alpha/beta hydrolase [Chloroflexota bacterium]|nr:alpha/beta hydrolase [Chloroflexota bacterium]